MEAARKERLAYMRAYRMENRDKINQRRREWNARNPERVREQNKRYWERRAAKRSIRASWDDYGISKERLSELKAFARADENAEKVLSAALAADRVAAGHIILSATKKISYEKLEFHEKLGRCPLGRTDFYGARRLFFHYLDEMLKNSQEEPRDGKEECCEERDGAGAELSGERAV